MIPLFGCISFKVSETVEWKPGEMRSNKNRIGPNVRYPMQKDASGDLVIGGGIAVRSQIKYGGMSEPEPVPLDGARGPYRHGAQETNEPLKKAYGPFEFGSYADPEYWADRCRSWQARHGQFAQTYPGRRDSRECEGAYSPSRRVSSGGNSRYVLATVKGKDPLVNKFPGRLAFGGGIRSRPPQFLDTYSSAGGVLQHLR